MLRALLLPLMVAVGLSASAQRDIDTLARVSSNAIKSTIKYRAKDSVAINLDTRHAFLYTDGSIDYDKMILQADRVDVDFENQILHAHGTTDTAGNIAGRPYFKQDDAEYHADTITFMDAFGLPVPPRRTGPKRFLLNISDAPIYFTGGQLLPHD